MRFRFPIKASVAIAMLFPAFATLHAETTADELIKNGDVFDAKLQESEALKNYLPAEKLEPKNARLLIKISRQYRHKAVDTASREQKIRLENVALSYAQRAAALAPNEADAQVALAICYGKLLPFEGTKEQLEASPRIKAAADKALELDPHNDIAWHILGRWHKVLADVSGVKRALGSMVYGKIPSSTNEEAVKCFEKAIELNPHRLRHYVALGQTYAQMGKTTDARRLIEKGLAMPDMEKDDGETKLAGREDLAKLH